MVANKIFLCLSVCVLGRKIYQGKTKCGKHEFPCNLSRNNVVLQVEMVSCGCYHLLSQQILMSQKVDVTFTFCNLKIC